MPLDRRADTYDAMASGVATKITSKPTNHVPSMLAPPASWRSPQALTGRADETRSGFVVFSHGYLFHYSKARGVSTMNWR